MYFYYCIIVDINLVNYLSNFTMKNHLEKGQHSHQNISKLPKAQKIKLEFAKTLQHELRNPLVGITSLSQVLNETYDKLSDNQRKQSLKIINNSAEKLNNLINNILDLSKLIRVKNYHQFKSVNLSNLVRTRIEICKDLYIQNQKFQQLILDVEDNIEVNCNEYYISRAIDNIIINTINHHKKGTIIVKLLNNSDNKAEFTVVNKTEISKSTLTNSKTKSTTDHGIGLALAKKIIDLHEGEIWTKSNYTKDIEAGFSLTHKD